MSGLNKIIITFLAICICIGCKPREHNSYKFANMSDVPVVDFRVNGQWMSFLVDTGAELNLLSIDVYRKNPDLFTINDTIYTSSITANGIDTTMTFSTIATINDTMAVTFRINTNSTATEELSRSTGRDVAGILSIYFIKENGIVFDYGQRELLNFREE